MTISLKPEATRKIIRSLLIQDESHRVAVFDEINRQFLEYAVEFFARVARAKLLGEELRAEDWYESELILQAQDVNDVAISAGIPMKTIENIRRSTRREIVVETALDNYRSLHQTMEELLAVQQPEIILTIKLGSVGVDLSVSESLIVINSLAVKRDQIRGGMWSAVGNGVEKPLMRTLCLLFQVPDDHAREAKHKEFKTQIDYVLKAGSCDFLVEVKLSGKGNPETAKAAIAHKARLFVADTIGETSRVLLEEEGVEWVELGKPNGYLRLGQALKRLDIPHSDPRPLSELDDILDEVLGKPGAEPPGD